MQHHTSSRDSCNTFHTSQFCGLPTTPTPGRHPPRSLAMRHSWSGNPRPSQPPDAFQLELSYLLNKQKVLFMLHLPAMPKDAMVQLLPFLPFTFPLVHQDTSCLLQTEDNVIVLSKTTLYLSLSLLFRTSTANLLESLLTSSTSYSCPFLDIWDYFSTPLQDSISSLNSWSFSSPTRQPHHLRWTKSWTRTNFLFFEKPNWCVFSKISYLI